MICTPELGVMLASDYLALHGLTLPEGVGIRRIYAVSADGMTFGGALIGGGGFVATVPAPGVTGLLAAAGLFASRRRRG
ncbi:MAG: PEP-CTERM sorting domain-containing protein [Phycisphaeraceae bacterium]|nr:PEP-CTERM sorting domain-containing protein [Phycisphaeraceae bacterium]